MTTSSRITSGFSARAWNTASRALPASPTGSRSVLRLEQQAQPAPDDGVVVDDQDPDAHAERHLRDDGRSGAGRDSTVEPAVEQAEPLAHAEEPEPVLAHGALGSKPVAVVLDHGRHPGLAAWRCETLTLRALACLTMFVSDSCTTR